MYRYVIINPGSGPVDEFDTRTSKRKHSMKPVTVTHRGWAGHFICAHDCRFRLNTLLDRGDIAIVVSTVGNFHPRQQKKIQKIGKNYYETMAFVADDSEHQDADVSRRVPFDSEWKVSSMRGKLSPDIRAQRIHEAVVEEIRVKLENETLWIPPQEDKCCGYCGYPLETKEEMEQHLCGGCMAEEARDIEIRRETKGI